MRLFNKFKFCGNLASSKSIGTIFPTPIAHVVSLCHISLIFAIFKFSIIIIFIMGICDQWSLMLLLQKDYDSLKTQMVVNIF